MGRDRKPPLRLLANVFFGCSRHWLGQRFSEVSARWLFYCFGLTYTGVGAHEKRLKTADPLRTIVELKFGFIVGLVKHGLAINSRILSYSRVRNGRWRVLLREWLINFPMIWLIRKYFI